MSAHSRFEAETSLGRAVNSIEETLIAAFLGLMTLVTFINVVLRYGFGTGLYWGAELVVILFAWLVLIGISHCVKITAHLGVDALTSILPPPVRKGIAVLAGAVCILYAFLLLKGGWDYFANFANLPQTTGRWFPTGLQEMRPTSYRAWYVTETLPFPSFLAFLEDAMNEGETYEKLPRFIPYAILPLGFLLLLFRFVQATVLIWRGARDGLIVSHEVEDAIDALGHSSGDRRA